MLAIIFTFLAALFFAVVLTVPAINFAKFYGWMDSPDGILKHQVESVPRIGGLVIFFAMMLSTLFCLIFLPQFFVLLIKFFFSTLPFLLIGLLDDKYSLSPVEKFVLQFLAAIFFVILNVNFIFFSFLFVPVLIFLILAIVNAFNLIDVSDGLAGLVSLPIFLFFFASFFALQNIFSMILSVALIGAVLGFLYFNLSPAKIYLGDGGAFFLSSSAVFLVFLLLNASFPLPSLEKSMLLLIFLFGIPLAEVFWLILIRLKIRRPIYLGSPHHFSIYLKMQKLSSTQIGFLSMSVGCLLSTLIWLTFFGFMRFALFFVNIFLGFSLWSFIIYHPSKFLYQLTSKLFNDKNV